MASRAGGELLYDRVVADIQSLIESRALAPGDRLPSIHALGEKYKVSSITIRAALNKLVSRGYLESRPRSGLYVRERRMEVPELAGQKVIGLLVTALDTQFFSDIIRGVEEASRAAGYLMVVANSNNEDELEARYLKHLSERLAGLIIAPVVGKGNYAAYSILLEKNVPFVFVDRYVEKLSAPLVATDNERGGYLATSHLLEAGRRQVFVLVGRSATSCEERVRGYRQALHDYGIELNPRQIRYGSQCMDQAGYVLTQEVLEARKGEEPFGIFAINEYIARGSYVALKEAGLRIPEDVAVAAFDDALAPFLEPSLTTVRQNPKEMGASALRMLLDVIRFGDRHPVPSVRLAPELVIRGSTSPESDFSISEHIVRRQVN
ncbi:MAG: GntR family transcriptional regulator [Planctomycetes bacterium]|nr:GntR family transcriptional regulator [Planctomycetota bacterium]